MCGIIFAKSLTQDLMANKYLWELYNEQKTRGTEGFGFLGIGKKVREYRACYESEIKKELDKREHTEILFHHRYPTSTPNFVEATHPILVSNKLLKYDYYVVHNGHINNCDDLKTIHNNMGFEYTTEIVKSWKTRLTEYEEIMYNDSESLAIELALCVENLKDSIDTTGNVAVIAVAMDKKTKKPVKLYYGSNGGNPLKLKKTKHYFVLSSQNTGEQILEQTLHVYDYDTNTTTHKSLAFGETIKYIPPVGFHGSTGVSLYGNDDYDDTEYSNWYKKSHKDTEIDIYDDVSVINDEDEYWEMLENKAGLQEELRNLKGSEMPFADEDIETIKYEISLIDQKIKDFDERFYAGKFNS